jgi:hypothetical protein
MINKIFIFSFSLVCLLFTACSNKKDNPTLANDLKAKACNNIVDAVTGAVSGRATGSGVITSNVPLSPATVGGIAAQTAAQQAQICAQNVTDIMRLLEGAQQACFSTLTNIWQNAVTTGMPYTGGKVGGCTDAVKNFALQFNSTMLPGGIALANTGGGRQWFQDALSTLLPNGNGVDPSQMNLAMSIFQNGFQPYLSGLGNNLGSIANGVVNYGTSNTQVAYNPFAQTGANGIQVLPGTTTSGVTPLGSTTGTSGVVNFGLTNNQVIDLRALK